MSGGNSELGEFELIEHLLAPLTNAEPGAYGLADDAAVLDVPMGQQLVVTKDVLVGGVHFFPDDPADLVARKALRVNLSDLASMGATPWRYTLGLVLPPSVDRDWLRGFVRGLETDQAEYGITLIGGDTVSTPGPMVISLTAMGLVPTGAQLQRSGATPGDAIMVSGTVGDAALGLQVLRNLVEDPTGSLVARYRLPLPRLGLGPRLRGIASSAIDISDGLVADLGHLCKASGTGAVIQVGQVPLSEAARAVLDGAPEMREHVLTGGDDYELLLTVPPAHVEQVREIGAETDVPISCIGEVCESRELIVMDRDGQTLNFERTGYQHLG